MTQQKNIKMSKKKKRKKGEKEETEKKKSSPSLYLKFHVFCLK